MAKISAIIISCSSDADLDSRRLFLWGAGKYAKWLPDSMSEAKKRVIQCKRECGCDYCDAEIHKIELDRTKLTKKQSLR